jgi:hypothetical protein
MISGDEEYKAGYCAGQEAIRRLQVGSDAWDKAEFVWRRLLNLQVASCMSSTLQFVQKSP